MQRFALAVLLLAALWSIVPGGSPIRSLFDQVREDPTGGVTTQGDPEVDPIMINTPPPRRQ